MQGKVLGLALLMVTFSSGEKRLAEEDIRSMTHNLQAIARGDMNLVDYHDTILKSMTLPFNQHAASDELQLTLDDDNPSVSLATSDSLYDDEQLTNRVNNILHSETTASPGSAMIDKTMSRLIKGKKSGERETRLHEKVAR